MPTPPTYATDTDLLHWEPNVPRDAAFASQTLIRGTGTLDGTRFTITAGSFTDAMVEAGHVIVLEGDLAGCYPILDVNSATELTVSTLHQPMRTGATPVPAPIGSGAAVPFVIRTFAPQRGVVSDLIRAAAGIGEGTDHPDGAVLHPVTLRRACVFGTLHLIYRALMPVTGEEPGFYDIRADLYERLHRRALREVEVVLDLDGDGVADVHRKLGVLTLARE